MVKAAGLSRTSARSASIAATDNRQIGDGNRTTFWPEPGWFSQARTRLTQVQDDAVQQIVLADSVLRTSLSAYSASQALEEAAQTTFDSALAAYRNGVGSITALTLAKTQLLQANNGATDAYSAALSAAATLALSTGSLGAAPE